MVPPIVSPSPVQAAPPPRIPTPVRSPTPARVPSPVHPRSPGAHAMPVPAPPNRRVCTRSACPAYLTNRMSHAKPSPQPFVGHQQTPVIPQSTEYDRQSTPRSSPAQFHRGHAGGGWPQGERDGSFGNDDEEVRIDVEPHVSVSLLMPDQGRPSLQMC